MENTERTTTQATGGGTPARANDDTAREALRLLYLSVLLDVQSGRIAAN